jgi:hypothetical protein
VSKLSSAVHSTSMSPNRSGWSSLDRALLVQLEHGEEPDDHLDAVGETRR